MREAGDAVRGMARQDDVERLPYGRERRGRVGERVELEVPGARHERAEADQEDAEPLARRRPGAADEPQSYISKGI